MKQSNHTKIVTVLLGTLCLLTLSGCGKTEETQSTGAALHETIFLAAAPQGSQTIASLKADAKEGDRVVLRAVIGGRENVFVANRAVMTVIGPEVTNACLTEEDGCKTPWDYCCAPPEDLVRHMATVQINGPEGRPLTIDLNTVPQVKPLSTVVIEGTVGPRSDPLTLIIHATGIFVEQQTS